MITILLSNQRYRILTAAELAIVQKSCYQKAQEYAQNFLISNLVASCHLGFYLKWILTIPRPPRTDDAPKYHISAKSSNLRLSYGWFNEFFQPVFKVPEFDLWNCLREVSSPPISFLRHPASSFPFFPSSADYGVWSSAQPGYHRHTVSAAFGVKFLILHIRAL